MDRSDPHPGTGVVQRPEHRVRHRLLALHQLTDHHRRRLHQRRLRGGSSLGSRPDQTRRDHGTRPGPWAAQRGSPAPRPHRRTRPDRDDRPLRRRHDIGRVHVRLPEPGDTRRLLQRDPRPHRPGLVHRHPHAETPRCRHHADLRLPVGLLACRHRRTALAAPPQRTRRQRVLRPRPGTLRPQPDGHGHLLPRDRDGCRPQLSTAPPPPAPPAVPERVHPCHRCGTRPGRPPRIPGHPGPRHLTAHLLRPRPPGLSVARTADPGSAHQPVGQGNHRPPGSRRRRPGPPSRVRRPPPGPYERRLQRRHQSPAQRRTRLRPAPGRRLPRRRSHDRHIRLALPHRRRPQERPRPALAPEAIALAEQIQALPPQAQHAWYERNMRSVHDCAVLPDLAPASYTTKAGTP